MAVELALQADRASDADAAHQPADPVAQDVGAVERLFHQARVAGPGGDLAHRRPFRPLDAVRAIPFRIFRDHDAALIRRHRPRATGAALILELIVAPILIRLLLLLQAYRIDRKLERFAGGGGVFAEIPQPETVVAIERLDDIGLGVELNPHLAEIVAQQHADLAADRGVLQARQPRLEHLAPLGDKTVVVLVGGIEQGPSQPREQGRGRGDAGRHGDMVGRPELAQSRQLAHRQQLDAGVLDQGDERDLQRLQAADGKFRPAEHEMRLGMRRRGSI